MNNSFVGYKKIGVLFLLAALSVGDGSSASSVSGSPDGGSGYDLTTAEQARADFYDDFVAKTLVRGAHVTPVLTPIKWSNLGVDGFAGRIAELDLRTEFIAADTSAKMRRAIVKLNNARMDRHIASRLKILRVAPIKFYPDFSDEANPFFFVANMDQSVSDQGVARGDRLLAINGINTSEYIDRLSPFLRFSTTRHMLVTEAPRYLSARDAGVIDSSLYQGKSDNTVTYTLESFADNNTYDITLQYNFANERDVSWLDPFILELDREDFASDEMAYESQYTALGFTQIFDTHKDAALYVNHAEQMALIEWYDFDDTRETVQDLIAAALAEGILDYDLIVDATHSGGGNSSALLVQILASEAFKTTFGNVRTDDIAFVNANKANHGSDVEAWIQQALDGGASFTTNEPFKLEFFPQGGNGIMEPAEKRFTGNIVALFFPLGGSNLDQFASMVIDNPQLGIHTIGMPPGGYSNTWEWKETLNVPGLGDVDFEWNIGHTIRPNGEILEGNPAEPVQKILFTRDNFDTYFADLIEVAQQYLNSLQTDASPAS